MDDFTVKPRDSTSRIGPGRQASPVRTELAPAQSVTASSSSAPRGGGPQGEAASHASPHDFHLAPQSQKVIDREREVSRRLAHARLWPIAARRRRRARKSSRPRSLMLRYRGDAKRAAPHNPAHRNAHAVGGDRPSIP
jgi:hypothetical protein